MENKAEIIANVDTSKLMQKLKDADLLALKLKKTLEEIKSIKLEIYEDIAEQKEFLMKHEVKEKQ